MYNFAYHKPLRIDDAVQALGGDGAKALAGGQTLLPVLKLRLNMPTALIDLAALPLRSITIEDGTVRVGAMTTHATLAANPAIAAQIPGLSRMAGWIGDIQVRHRGTIGGSLANNDPSACYPAAMLALGATIITDRRRIEADTFFKGLFTTALAEDELITEVRLPVAKCSGYEKFRNPASRYALVGVFVAKRPNSVRVTITGAGQNGVFRHTEMEQALARHWSPTAIAGIVTSAEGLTSDLHASAAYRAHLIGVMARRAVAQTLVLA